jgi:hypothetical protein
MLRQCVPPSLPPSLANRRSSLWGHFFFARSIALGTRFRHRAIATAPPPLPCRLASSATPTYLSRRVNWTRCKATSCSFRNSTRASMVATWPQARKRRRGASPAPGTAPGGAATRSAAGARRFSTGRTRSVRRSSRSPKEVGDARHASPRSSSSSTPPCRCPVPTPRRRGASRLLSAYARSLWVWVRKSHPSVWLPVMGRLCHRRAASGPHGGGTTRTTACCTRRPPIQRPPSSITTRCLKGTSSPTS